MRQMFVDIETTGLEIKKGNRIIEFAAIEMDQRKLTGRKIHFYFNTSAPVEKEALKVHGITNQFLENHPHFYEKMDDIMHFIKNTQIIIHNASFDISFLNNELSLNKNIWGRVENHCKVLDTLLLARKKHPGQRNSLDALCSRYGVNNKNRNLHGALLDCEILSNVYLMMTGGQIDLLLQDVNEDKNFSADKIRERFADKNSQQEFIDLKTLFPNSPEHDKYLSFIDDVSKEKTLWRNFFHEK